VQCNLRHVAPTEVFAVFVRLSRRMLRQHREVGHDYFLPNDTNLASLEPQSKSSKKTVTQSIKYPRREQNLQSRKTSVSFSLTLQSIIIFICFIVPSLRKPAMCSRDLRLTSFTYISE
jgi:hypothetical protein